MSDDLIERLRETVRLHTERARSGEGYDGCELRAFADEAMEAADSLAAKDTEKAELEKAYIAEVSRRRAAEAALLEMRAELERTARTALSLDNELLVACSRATAAEAQLERLREALAPFAKVNTEVFKPFSDHMPDDTPAWSWEDGDDWCYSPVTIGDFRRAARSLSQDGEEGQ